MSAGGLQKLWWTIPVGGLLVLAALALLVGKAPEPEGKGTSYDSSPSGLRGAVLLLEELGYPVVRSKRPTEGSVRWILFPRVATAEAKVIEGWVRAGGLLLLADDSPDFAHLLGIDLRIEQLEETVGNEKAVGGSINTFFSGSTRVSWPNHAGSVWAGTEGGPIVTIYEHGRGQIWLVNRPHFLRNRWLGQADNAILVCRLADAMLQNRPGHLAVDEYFHGQRERPGVVELLLKPPTLWVTVQGLAGLGLLLWHYMPRFGTGQDRSAPRRRSKEEFLDAMASLMERKGAYAEAFRTARDDLMQEMRQELGLPADSGIETLLREATERRPIRASELRRLLAETSPGGASKNSFLTALTELETIRDEFFQRRPPR